MKIRQHRVLSGDELVGSVHRRLEATMADGEVDPSFNNQVVAELVRKSSSLGKIEDKTLFHPITRLRIKRGKLIRDLDLTEEQWGFLRGNFTRFLKS